MKNGITLSMGLLLFSLAASDCHSAPPVSDKPSSGRYQLFQGKYEAFFTAKSGVFDVVKQESLFRIDTETGKVWVFLESAQDGVAVRRFWVPIEEKGN